MTTPPIALALADAPFSPSEFTHWGPQVQTVDIKMPFTGKNKKDHKICQEGEDSSCTALALTTIPFSRTWEDNVFTRVGLDHAHYLGVDVQNDACQYGG